MSTDHVMILQVNPDTPSSSVENNSNRSKQLDQMKQQISFMKQESKLWPVLTLDQFSSSNRPSLLRNDLLLLCWETSVNYSCIHMCSQSNLHQNDNLFTTSHQPQKRFICPVSEIHAVCYTSGRDVRQEKVTASSERCVSAACAWMLNESEPRGPPSDASVCANSLRVLSQMSLQRAAMINEAKSAGV